MTILKFAGFAGFATLVVSAFAATPAVAQIGPTNSRIIPLDGANRCPGGWDSGNGTSSRPSLKSCYPRANGQSPIVYRYKGSCMDGFGTEAGNWCVKGFVTVPEYAARNKINKRDIRDRCPAGYHSYKLVCSSEYAEAPAARWKGATECKSNELIEWGVWCVSGYEKLSPIQVSSAAKRDWNNIYTGTQGKSPTQSPDDDYSELYRKLFGAPKSAPSINERAAPGTAGKGPDGAATSETPNACSAGRALGGALGGRFGKALGGAAAGC